MRRIIFILLFNSIGLIGILSQTVEENRELAVQLQSQGNYKLAIKEYQRCLFFDLQTNASTLENIGECYFELKNFDKASEFFDKAFNNYSNDSLKLNALFRKTESLLFNKDYGLALNELFGITDTLSGNNLTKKEFYTAIAYFGLDDFENAQNSFLNVVSEADTMHQLQIKKIFASKHYFKHPNPKTASILSMFVPGAGQFYMGDYRNGFNSLLLISGFVYLFADIAIHQTIFDAFLTIGPWYQRYYQGGYSRTETNAIEKRAKHRSEAFDKILEITGSAKKY